MADFDLGGGGYSFGDFTSAGLGANLPTLPEIPSTPTAGFEGMTNMPAVSGGQVLGMPAAGSVPWVSPAAPQDLGVMDYLNKVSKTALPWVQLGVGGTNIASSVMAAQQASQNADLMRRAERQVERATAPGISAAEQLVPAGVQGLLTGQLPPVLEGKAEQYENSLRQQLRDFYGRAGIDVSTMEAQMEEYVKQQSQVFRGELAGQLLQAGGNMEQVSANAEAMLGQMGQRQTSEVTSATAAAQQSLNRLLAASG